MKKVVVVSGGFDPIHVGHMRLIQAASKLGKLIVILNNDGFLWNKKGFVFMPLEERKEILEGVKGVSEVVVAIDEDMSVSKTIEMIKPDIFATGGDVTKDKVRELETCKRFGVTILYGVGGGKIQSSSWLTNGRKHGK